MSHLSPPLTLDTAVAVLCKLCLIAYLKWVKHYSEFCCRTFSPPDRALPVEEVAEELAQVGVVGLVVEPQRTAEVEVCGELGWCGGQGDRGCCREACAPRAPQMALSYPAPAPTDAPDL